MACYTYGTLLIQDNYPDDKESQKAANDVGKCVYERLELILCMPCSFNRNDSE